MFVHQPSTSAVPSRNHELHLRQVLHLAETWQFDREHTLHVAWLALRLFDELQAAHRLGATERFWLLCSAILHDIGRGDVGTKGHHKASLRIVMTTPILDFDLDQRRVIGSVARYHRKALPSVSHPHYAELAPVQRQIVNQLAALLRLADSLDKSHQLVGDVSFEVTPRRLRGRCFLRSAPTARERSVLMRKTAQKGSYLEEVLGRALELDFIQADAHGWTGSREFMAVLGKMAPVGRRF